MKDPKDSKGKVIIIPRPPRASNEQWVPVNQADVIEEVEATEAIAPDAGSLGPQTVTGPEANPYGQLKGAGVGPVVNEKAK
jgi:hypothetical protein